MLRYMLDTNVCVAVLRNPSSTVLQRLDEQEREICISTITLHELMHGADRSQRPREQRTKVANLLSGLAILEFDGNAAGHSGNIHATLAKAGSVIGAYDMLIAGHARSRGLTVVTNNLREFTRVDGLRCEDWL